MSQTTQVTKQKTEKALRKAVAGSVLCAALAHPDRMHPAIVGSIVKRVAGQLLAQFDIKPKRKHSALVR